MLHDAYHAGSLDSSHLRKSQAQTTATHVLFKAWGNTCCCFSFREVLHSSGHQVKQLLREVMARLSAEQGLERKVQCEVASNFLLETSNKLKWCKIHSVGPAPSPAAVSREKLLPCKLFFVFTVRHTVILLIYECLCRPQRAFLLLNDFKVHLGWSTIWLFMFDHLDGSIKSFCSFLYRKVSPGPVILNAWSIFVWGMFAMKA